MLYKRISYLLLGLLLASFCLSAQRRGRARTTDQAGIVVINPASGAKNIALNQRVVIRLARPVDPALVGPQTVRLVSEQGAVATTMALSENRDSITLTPDQPLEPFSAYTILVSPLDSEAGNPGTVAFRSAFRTGGDTVEADFYSVELPDYNEAVAPIDPRLIVEFDRPMDPATINAQTLWLNDSGFQRVSIHSRLDLTGRVLLVEPLAPLAVGQIYVLTVSWVADLWGGLHHSSGGRWTTGYDLAGPTLEAELTSFPSELSPLPTNITPMVRFNRVLDFHTVNAGTARMIGPAGSIALEPVRRGDLITAFQPATPLQPNTAYLFYLSGLRDLSGVRLGAPVTISFTTAGGPDDIPPQIVYVNPTSDRTVPPDFPITIIVDEPLDPIVLGDRAFGGNTVLDVSLSPDGRTVTAMPATPYETFVGRLRVQFGRFADLAGNSQSGLGPEVNFDVAPGPLVDDLPVVLSTIPAANANGVGPNPFIEVRVSEPPDPTTVNDQTVYVAEGSGSGARVAARRMSRRDFPQFTITLEPDAGLTAGAPYQIVFRGVRDLDGNHFPDTIIPFRTSPEGRIDTVTPKVAAIDPPDGAANVDSVAEIRITFDKAIHHDAASRLKWGLALVEPLQDWPASASIEGADVLVLRPLAPLRPDSQYRFRINGVPNLSGSFSLSEPEFVSTFHTAPGVADHQPPSVVAVYPEDGAVGVPNNTTIRIRFSEPIKPISLLEALPAIIVQDGVDIDGGNRVRFNYSFSSDYLTLQLGPSDVDFEAGALVAVGLGEGLTDLSGNPLPPVQFSFTLGSASPGGEPQVLEFRPPPAADALPGDPLLVTLDRPLRRAAVGEDLFVSSDGRWAPGTSELMFGGRVLRFRPNPEPAPGARVDVKLVKRTFNGWDGIGAASTFYFVKPAGESAPPRVLSISPTSLFVDTLIPRNFQPMVRFSEPIDPASMVPPVARVSVAGQTIDGAWRPDASQTVFSFQPNAPWDSGVVVSINILPGVGDLHGQTGEEGGSTSFRTSDIVDLTPPRVVAVAPPDNLGEVPINAWIRVSFSEPVAAASLTPDAIELADADGQRIAGRLQVFPRAYSVALVPNDLLAAGRRYVVRVRKVADFAGQPVDPFQSVFFTGSQVDVEQPTVLTASPRGLEQNWPRNSRVSIAFSEPVFAAALHPGAVRLRRFSGPFIAADIQVDATGRFAMLKPSQEAEPGVEYCADLDEPQLTDLAGNPLNGVFGGCFRTSSEEDHAPPQLEILVPPSGAQDVPPNINFRVAANEPLDAVSVTTGGVRLFRGELPVDLNTAITPNLDVVRAAPKNLLEPNTTYRLVVDGVTDVAGNAAPRVETSFVTDTGIDVLPPRATVNVSPEVPVAVNAEILIEFDEAVDPESLGEIWLLLGFETVEIQLTLDQTHTQLRLKPMAPLTPGTAYSVVLQNLTDLAGNFMQRTTFPFSTAP